MRPREASSQGRSVASVARGIDNTKYEAYETGFGI